MRQSKFGQVPNMNSSVNNQHMESKFKIRQDANDIVEVIFSDACLKFFKNEDSNKDQVISDLKKEIENLK